MGTKVTTFLFDLMLDQSLVMENLEMSVQLSGGQVAAQEILFGKDFVHEVEYGPVGFE